MLKIKTKASILFWIIASISILPFVLLAFFCHPGGEDYLLDTAYQHDSFWRVQLDQYNGWSGRFFTNLIKGLFIKAGVVTHSYYLPPLLLLGFTAIAAYYLLKMVNRFILNNSLSTNKTLQVGFVFLMLNIYPLANISENYYWFSASIIYQIPLVLFYLLVAFLIKRFLGNGKNKLLENTWIIGLLILLTGCNETFASIIITIMFFIFLFCYQNKLHERKICLLYFLIAFSAGLLVFITSGILNRQKHMNINTSYFTVLPIIGFRIYMVFFNLFKEPLVWVSAAFCFVAGSANRFRFKNNLPRMQQLWKPVGLFKSFLLLLLLLVCILTPILMVSKGAYPDRALNNVIMVAVLYVLVWAFCAGHVLDPESVNKITHQITGKNRVVLVGAALLLSVGFMDAWKTVFSGYFYQKVMAERDYRLQTAKIKNEKTVVIIPYNQALKQQIDKIFPAGSFISLKTMLEKPPVSIPFYNEAEDSGNLNIQTYYGLHRIIIQTDKP